MGIKTKTSKDNALKLAQSSPFSYHLQGKFISFTDTEQPLVTVIQNGDVVSYIARTCIDLNTIQPGDDVVLLFLEDNTSSPLVMGIIQRKAKKSVDVSEKVNTVSQHVSIDGHSVVFRAENSITLSCGESKITLTKDGKIKIRGKYVISHAQKANRIRGGSVELN